MNKIKGPYRYTVHRSVRLPVQPVRPPIRFENKTFSKKKSHLTILILKMSYTFPKSNNEWIKNNWNQYTTYYTSPFEGYQMDFLLKIEGDLNLLVNLLFFGPINFWGNFYVSLYAISNFGRWMVGRTDVCTAYQKGPLYF